MDRDDTPSSTDNHTTIAGMAEACRRFPPPTEEQTRYALRELNWGEQLVVSRMVQSKGGSDLYLYSLRDAAIFLLDDSKDNLARGRDRIIKLIDIDECIEWIRTTLGDIPLADALEKACPAEDPYTDRLRSLQMLVALRMVQYGGIE